MNISDWPISKIMQLPDEAFGRRFFISCMMKVSGESTVWDISELGFPEICVIWEMQLLTWQTAGARTEFRVALGDHLPTTAAEVDVLEPVFPGLGQTGAEPRVITSKDWQGFVARKLRLPIRASGRRLVVEFTNTFTPATVMSCILTVSSIPKDIPSWFG